MLTGLAALDTTDWSRLHHAYGRATDTPHHLRALLDEAAEPRRQALSHLWSAIIHQGTPWTATGPVALVVVGFLADERIDRGEVAVRADLLSFLVGVAEASECSGMSLEELERLADFDLDPLLDAEDDEALFEDDDAANAFYARSILGCVAAAPVLMATMVEALGGDDPRARAHASMGAVVLANTESMRGHAKDLEARIAELARTARDSDERSAHVLAMGELGLAPASFLEDESPAVRMCAALAPGLAANDSATAVLVDALEHHVAEIDEWFVETPPQFSMRPRFAVIARLAERVREFERLAAAAEAVARITTKKLVDFDWGPLLVAAFPDGSGEVRTEAQRRFLGALVDRAELWDPRFGNPSRWFKEAGLPYDRDACRQRLASR